MRTHFARLFRATVWAPEGVPLSAWRFRNIFRVVLPVTDLLFVWFGIVGWINGVGSVQDATGDRWQTWWSIGLAAFALLAFVGIVFPKLWGLELAAKLPLIGLVSVYVALFLIRGTTEPLVAATAGVIAILVLLPIWRVADLSLILGNWRRSR